MKTYLFYDLETTGRNKCFDQVLQFAAIRTDLELNELERHEIKIKLNRDVIPDPEAILIHHIPITEMLEGESEITAMLKIHALLNTPGTISCGYNTLGFDDEFLRFSFYRNLLQPYTHQWANDCARMDLYPIAILYYLYKPEGIRWPTIEGKPTFKLEKLSIENQLAVGNAHTAIVDVEATLALARLFMQNRDMWNYTQGYFEKKIDLARCNQLSVCIEHDKEKHRIGLMVGEAGGTDMYQFPALALGQHNHYKNQTLWLRLDKPMLRDTNPENITTNTWVVRKKPAEPGLLLPFTTRFIKHLSAERLKITEENIEWLKNNAEILGEIKHYHKEYTYPKVHNLDIDAALYETGFLTPQEQKLCQSFHQATAENKVQLLQQFINPNLQAMVIRILGRHYLDYLTPEITQKFNNYLDQISSNNLDDISVNYRNEKRLTCYFALASIGQLKATRTLDNEQIKLLDDLEKYLSTLQNGLSNGKKFYSENISA